MLKTRKNILNKIILHKLSQNKIGYPLIGENIKWGFWHNRVL